MTKPDSRSFRQLMGCFATGIAVATVNDGKGQPAGITINSLTSVSLDPPLVLFCLDRKAHITPFFEQASDFAINILSAAQEDISRSFADFRHHPQPGDLWAATQGACPILRDTLGWMTCRKTATYDGGDHIILLGEATELSANPANENPLLYFRGAYRRFDV